MKAHGKLRNVWREALITASQGVLTKKQAAEIVDNADVTSDDLDLRLIDLPKHRIAALLPEISASAGYVERPEG